MQFIHLFIGPVTHRFYSDGRGCGGSDGVRSRRVWKEGARRSETTLRAVTGRQSDSRREVLGDSLPPVRTVVDRHVFGTQVLSVVVEILHGIFFLNSDRVGIRTVESRTSTFRKSAQSKP